MTASRGDAAYRFVNLEGAWPGCSLSGVENDGGVLRLAHVPTAPTALPARVGDASTLSGPSRIGVADDGTIYVADPRQHRIIRIGPCDTEGEPLACLGGPGSELGELLEPHGVAVGPHDTLYVADTGNGRVQILDRYSGQVRGVIGDLRAPRDVAFDARGDFYVADAATQVAGARQPGSVQKYDRRGRIITSFWATMRSSAPLPTNPIAVVIVPAGTGGEALLVLDGDSSIASAFALDGGIDALTTAQWSGIAQNVVQPGTATQHDGTLYVSDAATGRVLVFDADGTFRGFARDVPSGVAGLGVDRDGRLVTQPQAGGPLSRFASTGFAETGMVVAGPFEHEPGPYHWFTVHCDVSCPPDTHVQLFTRTESAVGAAPPSPLTTTGALAAGVDAADVATPTAIGQWRAAPVGAADVVILNEPARYVWVAIALAGDGHATPRISQLKLDDDACSWLEHLPALYRRDDETRTFLQRALALFADEMGEAEAHLEELIRAIDPWSAPDDAGRQSWLAWLAGWLAFPIAAAWSDSRRRRAVASAFALEATRGTAESLAQLIELYAGATVRISDPAATQALWRLGDVRGSRLGFDTMVAPADPHGAVLGTVATLDRTRLLDARHDGTPAYAALANRFCVEAFAADFPTNESRRELVRVIEVEKPAHVTYHLCLLEPSMRVGAQGRVGIDTIVAGRSGVRLPDGGLALDDRVVLTDARAGPRHATIGRTARVGAGSIVT
jgi:phage tail-like protein